MLSLLKADFFRIYKGKLARIGLIVATVLPILMVLMYYGVNELNAALTEEDMMGMDLFGATTLIKTAFSLGYNIGLVIIIFSTIFVSLDMSSGTLRNKLISGHSRTSIYCSHLITTMIYNVVMIVIYASITTIFSFIVFKNGRDLPAEEIKSLIYTVIIGIFAYVFIATVTTLLSLVIGSVAPSIIITTVYTIGISLVTTVLLMINYSKFEHIVYMIPLFVNSQAIAITGINDTMFIEGMISYLIFGGLNVFLGLLEFNRKDLK